MFPERGFRRIVAVLSLAALAGGLVFTVALSVASVHVERRHRAIKRGYAESGCVGGADRGAKRLAFTPLEGRPWGPYRWRVEIPFWRKAPQPGVIPEAPTAGLRDLYVRGALYGTWIVSAPRELSRQELLRAITIHQKGWLAQAGVDVSDLPGDLDLILAKIYVFECQWEEDVAEYLVELKRLVGAPSTPLPSIGRLHEFYGWSANRLIPFAVFLLSPVIALSPHWAERYMMKWYFLPSAALTLAALGSIIPWGLFYFVRWIARGFVT